MHIRDVGHVSISSDRRAYRQLISDFPRRTYMAINIRFFYPVGNFKVIYMYMAINIRFFYPVGNFKVIYI